MIQSFFLFRSEPEPMSRVIFATAPEIVLPAAAQGNERTHNNYSVEQPISDSQQSVRVPEQLGDPPVQMSSTRAGIEQEMQQNAAQLVDQHSRENERSHNNYGVEEPNVDFQETARMAEQLSDSPVQMRQLCAGIEQEMQQKAAQSVDQHFIPKPLHCNFLRARKTRKNSKKVAPAKQRSPPRIRTRQTLVTRQIGKFL